MNLAYLSTKLIALQLKMPILLKNMLKLSKFCQFFKRRVVLLMCRDESNTWKNVHCAQYQKLYGKSCMFSGDFNAIYQNYTNFACYSAYFLNSLYFYKHALQCSAYLQRLCHFHYRLRLTFMHKNSLIKVEMRLTSSVFVIEGGQC